MTIEDAQILLMKDEIGEYLLENVLKVVNQVDYEEKIDDEDEEVNKLILIIVREDLNAAKNLGSFF